MKISSEILSLVQLASTSEMTVLITGPTGTGKSTLAKHIHQSSARRLKPFVCVNLASLHEGTFESELFGHERGAFTGADRKRIGRIEEANGGTLFLDEIGELTPRMQSRLLEVLQSKKITPLGSSREVSIDMRVIVATHRDLENGVKNGTFREDLFHRIRVLSLELKSLNDRPSEFDEMIHGLISELSAQIGKSILKIDEDVAVFFERYSWPGNIRELKNVLEFAVYSSKNQTITSKDLPSWFLGKCGLKTTLEPSESAPVPTLAVAEVPLLQNYADSFRGYERTYLEHALKHFNGRVNHTAREIGVHKTTLIRRLKEHGLQGRCYG